MTCYFRHLQEVFKRAGIELNDANRREIDRAIREIIGVKYGDCPRVWKEVKKRIGEDEESFILELKHEWSKHSISGV